MLAEAPSLIEREQPAMAIAWRIERQPVLAAAVAPPDGLPPVVKFVLVGQRDHDVVACHAAHLVEGEVDGVRVLEDIKRYDHVRFAIGHRNAVVKIGEDVRRWVDVEADVSDGMLAEGRPEYAIPAAGIEDGAGPDRRVSGNDALRLGHGAAAVDWQDPDRPMLVRYEGQGVFDGERSTPLRSRFSWRARRRSRQGPPLRGSCPHR
jgi:hypothetical protein